MKKDFIPLNMIPFIANMMAGKHTEEKPIIESELVKWLKVHCKNISFIVDLDHEDEFALNFVENVGDGIDIADLETWASLTEAGLTDDMLASLPMSIVIKQDSSEFEGFIIHATYSVNMNAENYKSAILSIISGENIINQGTCDYYEKSSDGDEFAETGGDALWDLIMNVKDYTKQSKEGDWSCNATITFKDGSVLVLPVGYMEVVQPESEL